MRDEASSRDKLSRADSQLAQLHQAKAALFQRVEQQQALIAQLQSAAAGAAVGVGGTRSGTPAASLVSCEDAVGEEKRRHERELSALRAHYEASHRALSEQLAALQPPPIGAAAGATAAAASAELQSKVAALQAEVDRLRGAAAATGDKPGEMHAAASDGDDDERSDEGESGEVARLQAELDVQSEQIRRLKGESPSNRCIAAS